MSKFCEGPASHWAAAGQQGVATDEARRLRCALPLAFAAEHQYVDMERPIKLKSWVQLIL